MDLNNEQKLKFSTIMFKSQGRESQEIGKLNNEEVSKLRSIYAQKIAYDTVNGHIQPPPEYSPDANQHHHEEKNSGFISRICCCFYPESNRENFDITSSEFLKRILSTFLIWKSNFLQVGGGRPELYGFLWLTLTYVIILGLAANLNEYFILPQNYEFRNQYMVKGLGITAFFKIGEPYLYKAVVKCLQGEISKNQSFMLTGYSIVLYFIPTILCLIPSLYWHLGMLAIAGVLRAFFLFRNYGSKLPSKSFVILGVVGVIEALFCYVILKVMFNNDFGYNISDGTKRVFSHHLTLRSYQSL